MSYFDIVAIFERTVKVQGEKQATLIETCFVSVDCYNKHTKQKVLHISVAQEYLQPRHYKAQTFQGPDRLLPWALSWALGSMWRCMTVAWALQCPQPDISCNLKKTVKLISTLDDLLLIDHIHCFLCECKAHGITWSKKLQASLRQLSMLTSR